MAHESAKRPYNACATEEELMASDVENDEVFDEEELAEGFDEEIVSEDDLEDVDSPAVEPRPVRAVRPRQDDHEVDDEQRAENAISGPEGLPGAPVSQFAEARCEK